MLERLKNIVANAGAKALDYAEVKANPDLRGMNALAASFALLVMADKEVEEEELEAVSEYLIDEVPLVIEKGLIREISEMFLHTVDVLLEANRKGVVEFNVVVGETLRDIALIKDDPDYSDLVANTVTLVTSGGTADQGEIKTRDRILTVLGRN